MNEQGERKEGMQAETPQPELRAFRETVEVIARLGFILVGGCYVVGLLILNLHLGQYGVAELGFLQIKYVMVGALWAVLVGLAYFGIDYTIWNVRARYREWKEGGKRVGGGAVLVVVAIVAPFSVTYGLTFLSDGELGLFPDKNLFPTLKVLGVLVGSAWTIEVLIEDVQGALSRLPGSEIRKKSDSIANRAAVYNLFFRIIFLITMLSSYAVWAFPKFVPAVGGGRKQKVEFVAKADQINSLTSLGLRVSPEDRKIGPLELIYEASDFFTVEPPKEGNVDGKIKAIRIKKDLIDAAIYLSNK